MSIPDGYLPDEIGSRIDPVDYDKDLTQRNVALIFVHGERPYYNVKKMHAAVGSDVSFDTVRARLEELHERDILKREKVNNGNIYWLDREESDWPVPPDVEVEPERTEPTVTEWRQRRYVQVAALSVTLAIIGTAITLIGSFQAGEYLQLPLATSDILAVGLTIGMLSYLGLILAGLVWIFDSVPIQVDG